MGPKDGRFARHEAKMSKRIILMGPKDKTLLGVQAKSEEVKMETNSSQKRRKETIKRALGGTSKPRSPRLGHPPLSPFLLSSLSSRSRVLVLVLHFIVYFILFKRWSWALSKHDLVLGEDCIE